MSTSFAGPIARSRATDLVTLIDAWRADVVVCDEVDFGAMVAAEQCGIPHASVVVIAAGALVDPAQVAAPLDELRAIHRLRADPTMRMLTRHLVIVPVPPSFRDPEQMLPATALVIRPAVLDDGAAVGSTAAFGSARPLVYVTLGTIFNIESDDLLQRLVAAIRNLPIEVIVTVGPHLDPRELGPQPHNVEVHSFVPQHDVLRRSAAVVCHGGSGTVVGAIALGVPLVVIPLGADQLDNADRCTRLGVGVVLDAMTVVADEIRAATLLALHDPTMRAKVETIAAETLLQPPAVAAVDAIAALATRSPTSDAR